MVLSVLLTGCAASFEGGVVDPEAADQAVSELFSDTGERVLLQGGASELDQRALDQTASPNDEKFAIRTEQGIFMMTQMQLNQYLAQRRAKQMGQAQATAAAASSASIQNPYGRVVSRTIVPPSGIDRQPTSAAAFDPTSIKSTLSVPGAFERYVGPALAFTRGPSGMKNADGTYPCVMTLDDGPHHTRDAKIYDILDAKGIKAVFFFVGNKVKINPNTAKTALARGHEIGYHSWDHKNLRAESLATVKEDFRKGMEVFNNLGIKPKFFRPPFGNYNAGIIATAQGYGMEVINWTNDSLDWKIKTASGITAHVLEQSAPGDIVLLHSIRDRSVEALPDVIDGLRAQGCRFVSLETWITRATS